jgi:DNA polymerase III delta prime subunit
MIQQHLDKNNLHHAYLIEGGRKEILPEVLEFVKGMEVTHIDLDSLKIDDARNLKSYASEKSFSELKKIFIISTNNFLLEAQNALLKMFEEPIANTHFFVVVPDASALLSTFVSRFFLIKASPTPEGIGTPTENVAEKFIKMPLVKRLEFVKELVARIEDEDEEDRGIDSSRTKALKFLNSLESTLQTKMSKGLFDTEYFHHIFKVREFLRMPGSSPKTLMESVALIVPNF